VQEQTCISIILTNLLNTQNQKEHVLQFNVHLTTLLKNELGINEVIVNIPLTSASQCLSQYPTQMNQFPVGELF
jgi:hypothetical protein